MLFKHKYPFNCCCFIYKVVEDISMFCCYISEYIWKKLYSNIMDIRNNSSVSKLCLLNILYTLVRSQ